MDIDDQDVHLDENGQPRIVERRFVVDENFAGWRLDHYLKRMIPRLSRTKLQEIIRTQVFREAGREVKPSASVAVGELIVLRRAARPEPPCPRDFGVLYDHPMMMVIDKPAGLPVHVSAKFYFNTLTRVLSERYPDRQLQICHRLDRETSGALVLADGRAAAAAIKGQFAAHKVAKTYLAVVHGRPEWDERDIDLPLGLTRQRNALIDIRMEVRADAAPARTRAVVIERAGDFALVRCHPITGRQHQIRAHLAAVGHAIVGDKLYAHGDACFIEYCEKGMTPELLTRLLLPRQALHAASVELLHPETRQPFRVDSEIPKIFHLSSLRRVSMRFMKLRDMLDKYKQDHQHPVNRALHTVGIPMIVASLPILPFNPLLGASMFVFGWILQFVGHAFEGKAPSFFRDPRYLLVGPMWFLRKLRGRGSAPVQA